MVIARFYVQSIELFTWGTIIKMNVVTKGSEENKEFWAATPSGTITMNVKNEYAAAHFKPGQEMYVTFHTDGEAPAGYAPPTED